MTKVHCSKTVTQSDFSFMGFVSYISNRGCNINEVPLDCMDRLCIITKALQTFTTFFIKKLTDSIMTHFCKPTGHFLKQLRALMTGGEGLPYIIPYRLISYQQKTRTRASTWLTVIIEEHSFQDLNPFPCFLFQDLLIHITKKN